MDLHNITTLLSVPTWIGLIYLTAKNAQKISSFIHRKAKKKTTQAVIDFLKRPPQAVSVFSATRAMLPEASGGLRSTAGRLIRFAILYTVIGVVTVLSFGLLAGLAETDGSAWLFLRDHLALLPGAFIISWLVAWVVRGSLKKETLQAFLISLAFSAVASFFYTVVWPHYRVGMPLSELIGMAMQQAAHLTFLNPQMETASWGLFDRYGSPVPRFLLPGEVGFPSQFKLSSFHSNFVVFISITIEALFAAVTASWLTAYRRVEAFRVWVAKHFAVKDDPYLYAVIPPILAIEVVGFLIATGVAVFPKGG